MPTLPHVEMVRLLEPYLPAPSQLLVDKLSTYLDLLLKWNARTNLTAIRDPAGIVERHFGESLFAGQHIGAPGTLMDYGSGAGFPGIPIALLRPEIRVHLAESQHKKSAFLREAVRVLEIGAEVWDRRAEDLPVGTLYDGVVLRAVDDMASALEVASRLTRGTLSVLTTRGAAEVIRVGGEFRVVKEMPVPRSDHGVFLQYDRAIRTN